SRDDVDRSKHALCDESLVALELCPCFFDGIDLHRKISKREDEVPVSLFDLGDDLDRLLTKLCVRQAQSFLCDLDGPPVVVETKIPEQGLRVAERQGRRILRIQERVRVAGRRSR